MRPAAPTWSLDAKLAYEQLSFFAPDWYMLERRQLDDLLVLAISIDDLDHDRAVAILASV
jgi:hypothetical protein